MLLDLHETVKPDLNLVDAIDCMEGNGPSGGTVRYMGYTLASKCAYAADDVCAKLIGVQPSMIRTIHWARRRGWVDPDTIEIIGDPLIPADPPFILPDSVTKQERTFSFAGSAARYGAEPLHAPQSLRPGASGAASVWKRVPSILSQYRIRLRLFRKRAVYLVFAVMKCARKRRSKS